MLREGAGNPIPYDQLELLYADSIEVKKCISKDQRTNSYSYFNDTII